MVLLLGFARSHFIGRYEKKWRKKKWFENSTAWDHPTGTSPNVYSVKKYDTAELKILCFLGPNGRVLWWGRSR